MVGNNIEYELCPDKIKGEDMYDYFKFTKHDADDLLEQGDFGVLRRDFNKTHKVILNTSVGDRSYIVTDDLKLWIVDELSTCVRGYHHQYVRGCGRVTNHVKNKVCGELNHRGLLPKCDFSVAVKLELRRMGVNINELKGCKEWLKTCNEEWDIFEIIEYTYNGVQMLEVTPCDEDYMCYDSGIFSKVDK